MSGALAGYKKRGIVYVTGSLSCPYASQSYPLGVALARAGYSLMTGGVRKAVPRALPQPPRPSRQEGRMDEGGGPAHFEPAEAVRERVGEDHVLPTRPHGQRRQEQFDVQSPGRRRRRQPQRQS